MVWVERDNKRDYPCRNNSLPASRVGKITRLAVKLREKILLRSRNIISNSAEGGKLVELLILLKYNILVCLVLPTSKLSLTPTFLKDCQPF